MIILYHCYGGTHSSVLAAAIHLNILPEHRLPTFNEIASLPQYDRRNNSEIGEPVFYGKDEFGNKVYIQGMGKAERIVKNLLDSFLKIKGISKKQVKLINTLGNINTITRVGGFLSRNLGLIIPGRRLTVWGIQLNYSKFLKTVKRVKKEISIA